MIAQREQLETLRAKYSFRGAAAMPPKAAAAGGGIQVPANEGTNGATHTRIGQQVAAIVEKDRDRHL